MLFAIGTVTMFMIGGLSGVTHSVVPADYQQTDTYYVVAHFHYVLFGGAIFGLFAGIYYWWPKIFGRLLNETRGQGALLAHAHRLQPDVRADAHARAAGDAAAHLHLLRGTGPGTSGTMVATVGAFTSPWLGRWSSLAAHRLVPQAAGSGERPVGRAHARVDDPVAAARVQLRGDPDRDTTSTTSGTRSTSRTDEGDGGAGARRWRRRSTTPATRPTTEHGIHMPSPSYFPLIAALGLPILGYGDHVRVALCGWRRSVRSCSSSALYGWALEPSAERATDGTRRSHTVDGHGLPGARPDLDGAAQRQARDVAVPGVGVPVLRLVDRDLPARTEAPASSGRTPATCSTSRTPRSARSCCYAQLADDGAGARRQPAGNEGQMRMWLLTTALLGMVFVGGQIYEFTTLHARRPHAVHQPVRQRRSSC